jgi:hypothetical protein
MNEAMLVRIRHLRSCDSLRGIHEDVIEITDPGVGTGHWPIMLPFGNIAAMFDLVVYIYITKLSLRETMFPAQQELIILFYI